MTLFRFYGKFLKTPPFNITWEYKMDRFEQLKKAALPILQPYARKIGAFGPWLESPGDSSSQPLFILVSLRQEGDRPPLGLKWFQLEEKINRALGTKVSLHTESQLKGTGLREAASRMRILYEEG